MISLALRLRILISLNLTFQRLTYSTSWPNRQLNKLPPLPTVWDTRAVMGFPVANSNGQNFKRGTKKPKGVSSKPATIE